jgi:hypothetical protein
VDPADVGVHRGGSGHHHPQPAISRGVSPALFQLKSLLPARADAHFGRHAEAEQFALGVEFCEKPAFRFAIND